MLIAISGSQVSVLAGTLNIDDAIGERSTCSFVVRDDAGTMHFQKGQPVKIIDDQGQLVFAGVVDSAQEQKPGPRPLLLHRITCTDWHYLADKRIAAKAYENMAAGDIVSDLLASYLRAEGVLGTRAQPTFTRSSIAYLSNGTQVAANVPRFEPGKFGQAVMVEEGTTNLAHDPNTDNAWWNAAPTSGIVWGLSNDWSATEQALKVRSYSNAHHGHLFYLDIRRDVYFTLRAKIKNVKNALYGVFYLALYNSAGTCIKTNYVPEILTQYNWTGHNTPDYTEAWITYRIPSGVYPDAVKYTVQLLGSGTSESEIYLKDIQLEQKPYKTTWHPYNSTRSPEIPTIPGNVLNPQEGTVECWVYVTDGTKALDTYHYLFDARDDSNNKRLALAHERPGNTWLLRVVNDSGVVTSVSVSDNLSVGWHMFTARWGSAELALFIDGAKVGSTANPALPSVFASPLYVGSPRLGAGEHANALIDDLRISSRARTDAEIAAAYSSGQPLPFDDATMYLMRFDGSLTAETPIQAGPIVKEAVVNYRPVSEALDALAEKAGFVWWIDAHKVLHFAERATYTAPWTATGADMKRESVIVEHANPRYRNRQYIKGGRDITDPQVEIRPGDGNSRSFTVGFPVAKVPTVEVSRNGGAWTAQTVGIKGVDTGKQWYWSKGDAVLVQDDAEAVLGTADKVRITYQGEYDIVVLSEDYSAIVDRQQVEGGGTGYVEDVADEPEITSRDAAFQSANAKLKQYAQIGRRLKFRTRRSGLRPGQLLTVYLPEHKLDNVEMLIESVTVTDEQNVIWYDVTAVEGPEQGSWSRMFKALATRGQAFVERVNIGEDQILVVLQNFAESWPWAENVTCNVFACPVPSTTLYPSATLYPC